VRAEGEPSEGTDAVAHGQLYQGNIVVTNDASRASLQHRPPAQWSCHFVLASEHGNQKKHPSASDAEADWLSP
jgi:hypothetical protein